MAVTPGKCTGCSTCVMTCAITFGDSYDLKKAFIQIEKDDFGGSFSIRFSSGCRSCLKCAAACPFQCLEIIEVPVGKEGGSVL